MVSHQESTAGSVDVDVEAEEGQPSTANGIEEGDEEEDDGDIEMAAHSTEEAARREAAGDSATAAVQQLSIQEPAPQQ